MEYYRGCPIHCIMNTSSRGSKNKPTNAGPVTVFQIQKPGSLTAFISQRRTFLQDFNFQRWEMCRIQTRISLTPTLSPPILYHLSPSSSSPLCYLYLHLSSLSVFISLLMSLSSISIISISKAKFQKRLIQSSTSDVFLLSTAVNRIINIKLFIFGCVILIK